MSCPLEYFKGLSFPTQKLKCGHYALLNDVIIASKVRRYARPFEAYFSTLILRAMIAIPVGGG